MILLIILLSLLLAIFRPYYFVVIYGLIGTDMGSKGITGFIETIYPNYTLIMRVLFVISTIIATVNFYSSKHPIQEKKWINLCWLYIIVMIIMLSMFISGFTFLSYISRVTLTISTFGPGVFIIWMSYANKFNHKKLFIVYSVSQCLIAFLIIYGSYFGFSWFQIFNAGLYNAGYFYLDEHNEMIALPTNFHLTFMGKNSYFMRCGQFHNANGLGFASGVLIFLLSYLFYTEHKKFIKLFCLFGALLAFLLWCNTGTRGPIVGIVMAIILYVLFQKKKRAQIAPMMIIGVVFVVFFAVFSDSNILSYFFGGGADDSYASRKELNDNTFEHIDEFFLLGTGGDLDSMFNRGIDPHELPLRILCLYGIFPAILVTILTIIYPIKNAIIHKMYISMYSITLFCIVLLVSLTNNFSEGVLFWIVLCESILDIQTNKNANNNNQWILSKKSKRYTSLLRQKVRVE